jgi:hypothetical protein
MAQHRWRSNLVSPEVDFFLPNFPQLDVYVQPPGFNPGEYRVTKDNASVTLNNRFTSRVSRSGATRQLGITKRLSGACNPLPHDSVEDLRSVRILWLYPAHAVGIYQRKQSRLSGVLIVPEQKLGSYGRPTETRRIDGNLECRCHAALKEWGNAGNTNVGLPHLPQCLVASGRVFLGNYCQPRGIPQSASKESC